MYSFSLSPCFPVFNYDGEHPQQTIYVLWSSLFYLRMFRDRDFTFPKAFMCYVRWKQSLCSPFKKQTNNKKKHQQSLYPFCIFIDWQDIVRIQLSIIAVKLLGILVLPILKAIYMDLSECWQTDPYNLLLRLVDKNCYLMWQIRKKKQVRGNTEPWIKGKPRESSSSSVASDSLALHFSSWF